MCSFRPFNCFLMFVENFWSVNGQFDEFLMIMMLEMLIPPALESYKIRQIVHLQIKRPERTNSNVCQQKSFQPCFKGFQCLLPPSEQQWPDAILTSVCIHLELLQTSVALSSHVRKNLVIWKRIYLTQISEPKSR